MSSIPILYSGSSVWGVRKPAGLSTQAPAGCDSLEMRLKQQLTAALPADKAPARQYMAFPHRLDRCVSGVVLVALTKRAARLLSEQFASRKTKKTYLAVVEGHYKFAGSTDDAELWQDTVRKIPEHPKAEVCTDSDSGAKDAITEVRVLQEFVSPERTLLQLSPITGRMHQLRVQAASRGFPIVGDTLYTDGGTQAPSSICLHAESIVFYDPKNGRKVTVRCPDDDLCASV